LFAEVPETIDERSRAEARRPKRFEQDQAGPSKTKQDCLDLLGFIRPNRDFSAGYGEKSKKIPISLRPATGRPQAAGSIRRLGKRIALISDFRKEIVRQYLQRRRRHPPPRASLRFDLIRGRRRSRRIEGRSSMRPSEPVVERPPRRDASHRTSGRGAGAIPSDCNTV
jgi:hypothetical protein